MEPIPRGVSLRSFAASDQQQRQAFARSLGNHRVDAHRLRDALRRTAQRYYAERGLAQERVQRMLPPAPPPAWRGMPTTGNVKTFALLLDFADEPHSNSASVVHERLYGSPVSDSPYNSLADYYRRASYGKLELSAGNTLGWYRSSLRRADVPQTTEGREGLIKEALLHFKALGHDFSQYDYDRDGVVDYFLVFWTGPHNGWANFWWGYFTGFSDNSFVLDGVRLGRYSWQWESMPAGADFSPIVSIHETGHALGLPDLYDYDATVGPVGGVGGLDMMDANRGDHNAFSKWMLDWLSPRVVGIGTETLTLRPSATEPDCVIVWPGITTGDLFSEMFVVQNRQLVGNDRELPGAGLMVWHVDARLELTGQSFQFDNSYSAHKLVRLMECDGQEQIEAGASADAGDFFGEGAELTPYTLPSSARYDGTPSYVSIRVRAGSDRDMTATFSVDREAVTVYEHANYGGRSQTLTAGRYDRAALTLGDNVISSVRVPSGWTVKLYGSPGFKGVSRVITADTPRLLGFNEITSSISVEAPPPQAVVYQHVDFQGQRQTLEPGRYDAGQLALGDNVISSVEVPQGWTVTLYALPGFRGPSKVLTQSAWSLPGFNDRTSSIVVSRG